MGGNSLINMTARMLVDNKGFKAGLDQSNQYLKGFQTQLSNLKGLIAGAFAVGTIANFSAESARLAGEAEGVKAAFNKLNTPNLLNDLREATRGTVNDLDLMKAAVKAQNFKIPLEQLATYFEFAQKRASQTGESVDYLVESIINGIGRKSPMILDNLGISASELSEQVKKVGDFGQATGDIIRSELTKMGDVALTAKDKHQQLAASTDNLKVAWGNIVNVLGDKVIPVIEKYATQLAYALKTTEEIRNEARGNAWAESIKGTYEEITDLARIYVEKGIYPQEEATKKAAEAVIQQYEGLKKWSTATEQNIKDYDKVIQAIKLQYGFIKQVTDAEADEIGILEKLDNQINDLNEQKKKLQATDTQAFANINDKIDALEKQKKAFNELTNQVKTFESELIKIEKVDIDLSGDLDEFLAQMEKWDKEADAFIANTEKIKKKFCRPIKRN